MTAQGVWNDPGPWRTPMAMQADRSTTAHRAGSVAVVGSLNMDTSWRVSRIPGPGETLIASGIFTCCGGKGANQAVAASRAGANVQLLGCVGLDEAGTTCIGNLHQERIGTTGILRRGDHTGAACIALADDGENCILVNTGANHLLTSGDLEQHAELIAGAAILLLQLEVPLPAVRRAAEIARAHGVIVVLNPSPWHPAVLQDSLPVDILVVNEQEARALARHGHSDGLMKATTLPEDCPAATVIITRGAAPVIVLSRHESRFESVPPPVQPVDTVGAGDTFTGALAAALAQGLPLRGAVRFASTAAALSTLQFGAQTAMPHREAILQHLERTSASCGDT
jgi:ribokinase